MITIIVIHPGAVYFSKIKGAIKRSSLNSRENLPLTRVCYLFIITCYLLTVNWSVAFQ
jgi:hypothetical protein